MDAIEDSTLAGSTNDTHTRRFRQCLWLVLTVRGRKLGWLALLGLRCSRPARSGLMVFPQGAKGSPLHMLERPIIHFLVSWARPESCKS